MTPETVKDRLTGAKMPSVSLMGTDGNTVALDQLDGCTVLYIYPRTSPPGEATLPGWGEIPGASGCTPQSCGFRDYHADLKSAGVSNIFGLSVQDSPFQREVVDRLRLPFPILSDADLALRDALDLPTFTAAGMVFLDRMTLVIKDDTIKQVFYPISDPEQNAADVVAWLLQRAG